MPFPAALLAVIAQVIAAPDPVVTYGPWAVLTAVIGTLWKLHLDADARERALANEWKALAQETSRDLGRLTRVIEEKLDIKVPPAP